MKKIITLLIALIFFNGCASEKSIESFYKNWVKTNYNALNEIDSEVEAHGGINKIWTVGNSIQFSFLENGDKHQVELPENHKLKRILPDHNNMLYSFSNNSMSFGVGITQDCDGYICTIGVTRNVNEELSPSCNSIKKSESIVCYLHLYKEWHLKYHYINKNT